MRHWYSSLLNCQLQSDGRARTSGFWIPTGGITKKADKGMYESVEAADKYQADIEVEDAHDLLVRAGFLRQAYSGIFHMLPLGLRVQEKLERLIDKHMRSLGMLRGRALSGLSANGFLGASKMSLSSLSSQELWERSGRLKSGSEVNHASNHSPI